MVKSPKKIMASTIFNFLICNPFGQLKSNFGGMVHG
jgi:hypothetical protein